MNVVETIRQKVIHLPPKAQEEVLEIIEQIEERYQAEDKKEEVHALTLLAQIRIDAPPDFAERHDFYAYGKLEVNSS
jgi:hypothetical protein